MLNLNHPRTPLIKTAGGYTDRLKKQCHTYIFQNFEERQQTFTEMEAMCLEFSSYIAAHFSDVASKTEPLLAEIHNEIAHLRVQNNPTNPENCTVCNSEIKIVKTYVKEFPILKYCPNCPEQIIKTLNQLDNSTGAWMI